MVVVSETAARRTWPGENPIGKKVHSFRDSSKDHWFTVIGVAGDVHSTALDKPADCVIYFPYWQAYHSQFWGGSSLVLYVRTAMPAAAIKDAIRELVRRVDSTVGVKDRGTLTRIVSDSVAQRRFHAILTAVFGLIALGLAFDRSIWRSKLFCRAAAKGNRCADRAGSEAAGDYGAGATPRV